MVGLKRKFQNLIADPSPLPSSNSLDRRMKALRSCSRWNSALLHGRRTRGPQWDYATASYHVAKGSTEYYKGVTRIQSDAPDPIPGANASSSASNHPGPTSSAQFSTGLPSRLDRHPQQPLHSFQYESDQFPNRFVRHPSQHSLASTLGRPIGNPAQAGPYSVHPAHLPLIGNPTGIPQQPFNNMSNPPILTSNGPKSKSVLFPNQSTSALNSSNVGSSPHFQPLIPSSGNVGIARHMSTTPSLPNAQSDRKVEGNLSHPASYQNSGLPNQATIERPHSSQLVPTPQSFSPPTYPAIPSSFEKTPVESLASPTHSQALGSPAAHSAEPQIAASNRKLYPGSTASHHPFSHRPVTPGSTHSLAPVSGSANPNQVFQPMHVGYPPTGNPLVSISSQARNPHYNLTPNLNNLKPPTHQVLQQSLVPPPSSSPNETNPFASSQQPLSLNHHHHPQHPLNNNPAHHHVQQQQQQQQQLMSNNQAIPRPIQQPPPTIASAQFYPPGGKLATTNTAHTTTTSTSNPLPAATTFNPPKQPTSPG